MQINNTMKKKIFPKRIAGSILCKKVYNKFHFYVVWLIAIRSGFAGAFKWLISRSGGLQRDIWLPERTFGVILRPGG
jgi:hypothetical protein